MLRAEVPAGDAAVDLAAFAAAASAVGWPAADSNSSPAINQFIGFIVLFKVKFKTDASFFATWRPVKPPAAPMFLAREIIEIEKCKLDARSSGFGVPYRFYVGIETEFFDSIE